VYFGKSQERAKNPRQASDNLAHTTDFRRVYATLSQGWMGYKDTAGLLKGRLSRFPCFRDLRDLREVRELREAPL
jgi:hypothetical protein